MRSPHTFFNFQMASVLRAMQFFPHLELDSLTKGPQKAALTPTHHPIPVPAPSPAEGLSCLQPLLHTCRPCRRATPLQDMNGPSRRVGAPHPPTYSWLLYTS